MTTDDVKVANEALVESMVQQLRDCVSVGDEMTLDHASLIDDAADWIEGESQRIAAAVAKAREEQREADLCAVPSAAWGVADYRMGVDDARREIRSTPLTATPLADELERSWQETARMVKRVEKAEAERDEAVKALREVVTRVIDADCGWCGGRNSGEPFGRGCTCTEGQKIRDAAAVLAKYPEGA